MMTFQELRTKTPNLYPTEIPDDLQQTINDWFDSRNVCDDDNFARFFQRVLNRDYVRYKELLRIEPGIAKYDWLVTTYRERRAWGTNSSILSEKTTNTADGTSKKEGVTSGTTKGTMSNLTADNGNEITTVDNAGTDEHTDSTSVLGENKVTVTHSETTSGTSDLTSKDDKSNLTVTREQTGSATRTPDLTSATTSSSTTNTEDTTESSTKSANKQLPMNSTGITKGSDDRIASLNLTYASAIGETDTDVSKTGKTSDTGSSSVSTTGTETNTTSGTDNESYKGYALRTDNGTTSGTKEGSTVTAGSTKDTSTTTHSGSNTLKGTTEARHSNNNESNGQSKTENESSSTFTDMTKNNAAGTRRNSANAEDDHFEIYTGRDGASPQNLLDSAVEYIKGTSAWAWLQWRLESCFMGVYDV